MTMTDLQLTLAVFGLAVVLAVLESRPRDLRGRRLWLREAVSSVALGATALAIGLVVDAKGGGGASELGLAAVLGLGALVFLADDFLYYWSHRLAHRVRVFWASHAVHHSAVRFDFFMGLRQPVTWLATPAAVSPLLLIWIGAPPSLVALSGLVRAVWHYAAHTERVRKLDARVEFVLNTPSHHRVHHASAGVPLDCNFGGVLIVWDRLFGTFTPEPSEGIARYGLVGVAGRLRFWETLLLPLSILFDRPLGGHARVARSPPKPLRLNLFATRQRRA